MWLRLRLVGPGMAGTVQAVYVLYIQHYSTYNDQSVQEEPTAGRCIANHPTENCSTEAEMTKYRCSAPVP